jgi:hypothetical protein
MMMNSQSCLIATKRFVISHIIITLKHNHVFTIVPWRFYHHNITFPPSFYCVFSIVLWHFQHL